MATVPASKVVSAGEVTKQPLPARVQEALGELVGQAKEGLIALSVGVGLGVVAELMEEELDEVVGPKGKWNHDRDAHRHGNRRRHATLGGRRVSVRRPRMRSADGEREVPCRTYEHFADRDPLTRLVLEQMLAGVSTRRFELTREPVGEDVEAEARSTSKSAASRTFVERTRTALGELMSRRLDDVRLACLMIDAPLGADWPSSPSSAPLAGSSRSYSSWSGRSSSSRREGGEGVDPAEGTQARHRQPQVGLLTQTREALGGAALRAAAASTVAR